MSITSEDFAILKTEHKFIKEQLSQVLEVVKENTLAHTELQGDIKDLVHELKDRDTRDEIRDEAFKKLQDEFEESKPAIKYARKKLEREELFSKSMTQNWAKWVQGVIVLSGIALAAYFGVDIYSARG